MEQSALFNEIQLRLDMKDHEGAGQLLDLASQRWPASIRVDLLRGRLMEVTGSEMQACAHYHQLLNEHPRGFKAAPRLIYILVRAGKVAESRQVLCDLILPEDKFDSKLKGQLLNVVTPLNSPPEEAIRFLEALVLQGDLEAGRLIRLAEFHALRGRHGESLGACVGAEALGVVTERSQAIRLKALFNLGRFAEAYDLAQRLFEVYPLNREVGFLLATLSKVCGKAGNIAELYEQLLTRFPRDGKLLATIGNTPFKPTEFERLYAIAAENRHQGCYSGHSLPHYAYLCLRAGEAEEAIKAFAQLAVSHDAPGNVNDYLNALGRWPFNACVERARIPFSPSDHVLTVRVPEPKATVFCFAAFFNRINGLPSAFTDSILASFPVNVVYVSDPSYRLGLNGIEGLGGSPQEAAERLRYLAKDLGSERIFTLGASSGGFTASLYGALMDATAVISFAGPSSLKPDGSGPRGMEGRKVVLSRLAGADTDLRDVILKAEKTRFVCYYGSSCGPDVDQAMRLEGLANTRTVAIANCADHNVGLHMAARGELVPALEKELSVSALENA